MQCTNCGANCDGAETCPYCGAAQGTSGLTSGIALDPAVKIAFDKFDKNGGKWVSTFNFRAIFLWWYLSRGMTQKFFILMGLFILGLFVGIGWIAVCIYAGLIGNYDYYRFVKSGGKQPSSEGTFSWW